MIADEKIYKKRIWAWTMYDWANSAFATTILAAVMPIYYSQVAGSTLPSPAIATAYWGTGLSISLMIAAVLSPILGTISDVMRGKKRFLGLFMGIGAVFTGLLALIDSGDWLWASILFVIAKLGFNGANVFYDALLPHVAKPEDVDVVSTRGYAMGYLGGGLLLFINVIMIQFLPGTWGARLSFLSVGIWWAVFSIPIFRHVPEPHTTSSLAGGGNVISASFRQLWVTVREISRFRQLFKYLIAFLIYIDGIGTIIGVAAIYGAELGFGSLELILALLLVQFVGIPYSLVFGRLPNKEEKRRPFFLAFVVFNLFALPLAGILGGRLLPAEISGKRPAPYSSTASAAGQGTYPITSEHILPQGDWTVEPVPAEVLGADSGADYLTSLQPAASLDFTFNGQEFEITYGTGPDHGAWTILLDGEEMRREDGYVRSIDAYSPAPRYDLSETFRAPAPGEHHVRLLNLAQANPASRGIRVSFHSITVLPPHPSGNLVAIIALIAAVEVTGLLFAWLLGKPLFSRLAQSIDTKRGILLALLVYSVIAVWGFFLDSVIEYWFLAWMVAIVQGGSQALSRSLFASMSPASKSGEFFGLFGIMEKFSAVAGPLVFAWAATTFNSSRPAVLSIVLFFLVGGFLLTRVDVAEGQRVAQAEDARASLEAEAGG